MVEVSLGASDLVRMISSPQGYIKRVQITSDLHPLFLSGERLFLLNYHRCLFDVKVLFISVYMGVCLKVEYHRISLAISLFGCIFGCVNYTPENYEYQAQYHLCSGEP